jgi:hypothetical protein
MRSSLCTPTGCGLSKNGGATDHIRGLVALDLLDEEGGRYRTGALDGALLARVAALVDELERVPDVPIDEVLKGDRTAEGGAPGGVRLYR